MSRTITVSLPVADLEASKTFYTALGCTVDPRFPGGDGAAFVAWGDSINLVLLTHAAWRRLTDRPIAPRTSSEVGLAVSCDSREEVDAMNRAAGENGGTADINPVDDYPFMYGRDFLDPDGHVWGAKWMDLSAMPSS